MALDVDESRAYLDASWANRLAFWTALEAVGAHERDTFRLAFADGETYIASDLVFARLGDDDLIGGTDRADGEQLLANVANLAHIAWFGPQPDPRDADDDHDEVAV